MVGHGASSHTALDLAQTKMRPAATPTSRPPPSSC